MSVDTDFTILFKRGSAVKVDALLGAAGELVYNRDDQSLHLHDGIKTGGYKLNVGEIDTYRPSFVSPAHGAELAGATASVTLSEYTGPGVVAEMEIQTSLYEDMAIIYQETGWISAQQAYSITLRPSSDMYLRCRQKNDSGYKTAWSDIIRIRTGAGWMTFFTAPAQTSHMTSYNRTTSVTTNAVVYSQTYQVTTRSTYYATGTRNQNTEYSENTSHVTEFSQNTAVNYQGAPYYQQTYQVLQRSTLKPSTQMSGSTSYSANTSYSTQYVERIDSRSTSVQTGAYITIQVTSVSGHGLTSHSTQALSLWETSGNASTSYTTYTSRNTWAVSPWIGGQRNTYYTSWSTLSAGAGGMTTKTKTTSWQTLKPQTDGRGNQDGYLTYMTSRSTSYQAATSGYVSTSLQRSTSVTKVSTNYWSTSVPLGGTSRSTTVSHNTTGPVMTNTSYYTYSMTTRVEITNWMTSQSNSNTVFGYRNTTTSTTKTRTTNWTAGGGQTTINYTNFWETQAYSQLQSMRSTQVSQETSYATTKTRETTWVAAGVNTSFQETNFWQTSTTYSNATEWSTEVEESTMYETMVQTSVFTEG